MGFNNGYDSGYSDCEAENRQKWTQEGYRAGQASMTSLLEGISFKGEEASIGETRSALTTLWTKLGGTIACAGLMLAPYVCRGAAPGCARVSDLVDQEVVTNAVQALSADRGVQVATNAVHWSAQPIVVAVESNATLSCSGSWPTGRPVFVMVYPSGPYQKDPSARLVGYSAWPDTPWQGVVWCINDVFYFNILSGIE